MKIVLVGSPTISLAAFEVVIKTFDVIAVVTQPDRKKGRGMMLAETEVAKLAKKYKIKTFKPEKIISIHDELKALNFDLLLTFAFGQYIPEAILALGTYKPLNIHGSLLPKYRGAAPIHHAILNEEREIGITVIEVIKEMDAGNMLFKASQAINDKTTTGDAFKIISQLAAKNIVKWLNKIKNNDFSFTPQPDSFTLAPKIAKDKCALNSQMTIKKATRMIRGLNPFPGSFLILNGKRLKIFDIKNKEIKGSIKLFFSDGLAYAVDYQWENKKRIIL